MREGNHVKSDARARATANSRKGRAIPGLEIPSNGEGFARKAMKHFLLLAGALSCGLAMADPKVVKTLDVDFTGDGKLDRVELYYEGDLGKVYVPAIMNSFYRDSGYFKDGEKFDANDYCVVASVGGADGTLRKVGVLPLPYNFVPDKESGGVDVKSTLKNGLAIDIVDMPNIYFEKGRIAVAEHGHWENDQHWSKSFYAWDPSKGSLYLAKRSDVSGNLVFRDLTSHDYDEGYYLESSGDLMENGDVKWNKAKQKSMRAKKKYLSGAVNCFGGKKPATRKDSNNELKILG